MDCTVSINDLKVMAFIGCYEHERRARQELSVDLSFVVDPRADIASDEIGAVVDYDEAAAFVCALSDSKSWALIEKMALDAAEGLLKQFKLIRRVSVQVHKSAVAGASSVSAKVELDRLVLP